MRTMASHNVNNGMQTQYTTNLPSSLRYETGFDLIIRHTNCYDSFVVVYTVYRHSIFKRFSLSVTPVLDT